MAKKKPQGPRFLATLSAVGTSMCRFGFKQESSGNMLDVAKRTVDHLRNGMLSALRMGPQDMVDRGVRFNYHMALMLLSDLEVTNKPQFWKDLARMRAERATLTDTGAIRAGGLLDEWQLKEVSGG